MEAADEQTQKDSTKRRRRWLIFAATAVGLALLAGCGNVGYYSQAARGHFDVLSRTEPIEEVLTRPSTSAKLKAKLKLILEARDFAVNELKLEANGHYLGYADLERDSVVFNVFAAPELSLEPKRWWYPLIGRQSYRGYFAKEAAVACAGELKKEGYDTYVGGVDAYSTLGFFKDPVLNTWINDDDEEVVSLVIHELTHQRLYIGGDTAFNEAFATAVEIVGTRRWLKSKGNDEAIKEWEARQARRGQFIQLIKTTRSRLKEIYKSDESTARKGKTVELAGFRQKLVNLRKGWGNTNAYTSWLTKPVNNARLNTVSTYFDLVPAFLVLLDQQAGDFASFYDEVKRIGRMKKTDRRRFLGELVAQKNAPL